MNLGHKMGYTIKQKIDICLMAEQNPEMTQADLAKWAKAKYHTVKPPSQTTISRILSKKNELIALKENEFKLIRRRKPSNMFLREILNEWICQTIWKDASVLTVDYICTFANKFWNLIPDNLRDGNGTFTHKWCTHFLSKSDINLKKDYSRRVYQLPSDLPLVKNLLATYSPKDVFTLDEFSLQYQLPLDRALFSMSPMDKNVTVLLSTNADGSEKLEPLVVGQYEAIKGPQIKYISKMASKNDLSYKSNKIAQLTTIQFTDWLSSLDKRLSLSNRKIVLILDNCASHRVVNIKLEYIELLFVESGVNEFSMSNLGDSLRSVRSQSLPIGLGILQEFKTLYRLQQYMHCDNLKKAKNSDSFFSLEEYKLPLENVFAMIKNAWNNVSVEVCKTAWTNADLIVANPILQRVGAEQLGSNHSIWGESDASKQTTSVTVNTTFQFKNSKSGLQEMILQFPVSERWDIDVLLNLIAEEKVTEYEDLQHIVNSCVVKEFGEEVDIVPESQNKAPSITLNTMNTTDTASVPLDSMKQEDVADMLGSQVDSRTSNTGSGVTNNDSSNNNSNTNDMLFDDNMILDDKYIEDFINGQDVGLDNLVPFDPSFLNDLESNFSPAFTEYPANSLFAPPEKKANLSSVITIPDNSQSFEAMYSKKRKVSSLDEDTQPHSQYNSTYTSPLNHNDSMQSKGSSLSEPRLTKQERIKHLTAIVNAANNKEFAFSEQCLNELKDTLYSELSADNQLNDLAEYLDTVGLG